MDIDAVPDEFAVHQGAELGIDGGEDLGQHLDLRDGDTAGSQAFGHLKSDVAGADDQRGLRPDAVEAGGERERVAHRVQQVDPVLDTQLVEAVDRRLHGDGTSADDQPIAGIRKRRAH